MTAIGERFAASKAAGREPYVRVVMHSLAFGSLVPFLSEDPKGGVDRKKMEMTQDVMANSLVYWVQDLWRAGFLGQGSKIYAMTSEGSTRVVPSYGVVSSAKAALESHVRQLAMELARHGTGATANCIRAGVTITPALLKIPESQTMIDVTMKRNPTGRMTTPAGRRERDPGPVRRRHRVHQRRHHQRGRRRVHHRLLGPPRWAGSSSSARSTSTSSSSRTACPAPGETVIGGRFAQHHGGKGGNQAVAAARLGANVTFVGAVGDDAFGEQAHAALASEGVDLTGLQTIAGEATGVALILVDAGGENSIAVASGANAAVTPAAGAGGSRETFGPARATSSWSATRSPPTPSGRARRARAAGAITILNPAPATGLTRRRPRRRRRRHPERGRTRGTRQVDGGERVRSSGGRSPSVRPERRGRRLDRPLDGRRAWHRRFSSASGRPVLACPRPTVRSRLPRLGWRRWTPSGQGTRSMARLPRGWRPAFRSRQRRGGRSSPRPWP